VRAASRIAWRRAAASTFRLLADAGARFTWPARRALPVPEVAAAFVLRLLRGAAFACRRFRSRCMRRSPIYND